MFLIKNNSRLLKYFAFPKSENYNMYKVIEILFLAYK